MTHNIRGAQHWPNNPKYKAQNKTRLDVHISATDGARQSLD